jgi:limonene 1,2-monooxygenase
MTDSPVSADALLAPAQKLRSGIFLAPFHPLNEDPTLALRRDLELIEHLDRLGFDEAWIGEHHSAGFEIIASPELMIAAAAERTQRIRLGTGVVSLPYHHPLMVANRIVQLDHMTRGRVMLGVGPGLLPSDADMLGIDIGKQRDRMAESLGVILRLLAGEVVSHESEWFTLRNATCQLRPYTWPRPEVAVASTITPSGAKLAGKYGLGMLCVAATQAGAYDALGVNFQVACDTAQAAGRSFSRDGLRLVAPMHLAATRAQAREDVGHGLAPWADYFARINPNIPSDQESAGKDLIDRMIDSGRAVIGTPDDAIAQIERLQKQSGGFGCLLLLAHNWAPFDRTKLSYELFARYVLPAINRTNASRVRSLEHVTERREELTGRAVQAVIETFAKHQKEREQP